MSGIEPLPALTQVAIGGLLATVVALWIRPWWLWLLPMAVAIVGGYAAGTLSGPAALALVLLAFALQRFHTATGWARAGHGALAGVVSLLLALHLAPGFDNPIVIRDAVLAPGAIGYTQYANFDKGLAGVFMVAILGLAGLRSADGWGAALRQAGPIVLATIAVVLAASLALGHVRFDPRWTPLFVVWAPINLLLTCVGEEAFFRGFLQAEVAGALGPGRRATAMSVAASALLFGLAHAAGGWRYVLLASLAGTGYALAFERSGRLEMAILAHFAVNATHFLLFTYPALA
jgi:membrane protease YdiL (CAAX protease family)